MSVTSPLNTIRRQYLRALYKKVSTQNQNIPTGDQIDLKFVYGAGTNKDQIWERDFERLVFPDDTVVLEEPENMDDGKTLDWFVESRKYLYTRIDELDHVKVGGGDERHSVDHDGDDKDNVRTVDKRTKGKAANEDAKKKDEKDEEKKAATDPLYCSMYRFLGKGDDDTTIHLPRLIQFFKSVILPKETVNPGVSYYIGTEWQSYMTGLLYFLSTPLVEYITMVDGVWAQEHKKGFEDKQTGQFIEHSGSVVEKFESRAVFHDHYDSIYWDAALITEETAALHWNKDIFHIWKGITDLYTSDGMTRNDAIIKFGKEKGYKLSEESMQQVLKGMSTVQGIAHGDMLWLDQAMRESSNKG
ncbi:UNVERIFIED_CONTAM: hypothetical protein HDU68_012659 [Siphonaria sp. JEL0065]|nr:hypothetical protein HDU68_012659 [Siphonaria sp. JEL0065]